MLSPCRRLTEAELIEETKGFSDFALLYSNGEYWKYIEFNLVIQRSK